MLFLYISGNGQPTQPVSYAKFLKRFMPLWYKKKVDEREQMENLTAREREVAIFNEKRDMKKALERICFDMLDIDGNGVIDIVDLMQLCSHFHAKK